ncbi:MAG: isochorismatase family protein [Symploca sp. SIO2G7]|nr:isochorismatase family protein [Symploca sp. SIO2G7]
MHNSLFGNSITFGNSPALLVVDLIEGFVAQDAPFYTPGIETICQRVQLLITVFRQYHLPIAYTTVEYQENGIDGGIFVEKIPALRQLVKGSRWTLFTKQVAPDAKAIVVSKRYASAFFGTHLAASLTALKVDSLVIVGVSTSGCVRASAVDALQYGYRTIVVEDCVIDVDQEAHRVNLRDIQRKYGEVYNLEQVLEIIEQLHLS